MYRRTIAISVLLYLPSMVCVIRWEKRTLSCDADDCQLSIRGGPFKSVRCELDASSRHFCDISCEGADRDSVISKSPTMNRQCIRFHSYNTEHNGSEWRMWRDGKCAKQKIVLEVHCGFPLEE